MFIKSVEWKKLKEECTRLKTEYTLLEMDYERVLKDRLNEYNDVGLEKGIIASNGITAEEEQLLTNDEQDLAIKYYNLGWNVEKIIWRLLSNRNEKIRRDMLKELGVVISKSLDRQLYPVEFYGKVNK